MRFCIEFLILVPNICTPKLKFCNDSLAMIEKSQAIKAKIERWINIKF